MFFNNVRATNNYFDLFPPLLIFFDQYANRLVYKKIFTIKWYNYLWGMETNELCIMRADVLTLSVSVSIATDS